MRLGGFTKPLSDKYKLVKKVKMKEQTKNALVLVGLAIAGFIIIAWIVKPDVGEKKYSLTEIQEYAEERGRTGISNSQWQDFEIGFVEACNSDGLQEEYCNCTLKHLESNNTRESIYQMAADILEMDENDAMPKPMRNAAYACLDLFVE